MLSLAANPFTAMFAAHNAALGHDRAAAGMSGLDALFAALLDAQARPPMNAISKDAVLNTRATKSGKASDPRDGSSATALIAAAPASFTAPMAMFTSPPDPTPEMETSAPLKAMENPAAASVGSKVQIQAASSAGPEIASLPNPAPDAFVDPPNPAVSAGNFAWPKAVADDVSGLPRPRPPVEQITVPTAEIPIAPSKVQFQAPTAPIAMSVRLEAPVDVGNAPEAARINASDITPQRTSSAPQSSERAPSGPSAQVLHSNALATLSNTVAPRGVVDRFVAPTQKKVVASAGHPDVSPRAIKVARPVPVEPPAATSLLKPEPSLRPSPEPVPPQKATVLHLGRMFEPASLPAARMPKLESVLDREPQAESKQRPVAGNPEQLGEERSSSVAPNLESAQAFARDITAMPLPVAAIEAEGKRTDAPVRANSEVVTPEGKDPAPRKSDNVPSRPDDAMTMARPASGAVSTAQPAARPDPPATKQGAHLADSAARSREPAQPISGAQPASVSTHAETASDASAVASVTAPPAVAKIDMAPLSQAPTAQRTPAALPHADPGAIAVRIAAKSREGDRHFDIRLDPPELGRIDVHLFVDQNGRAEAHLAADKPHTLALLQRDSAELQRGLKEAGLELSNNGLNFSLKGQEHREAVPQPAPRLRAPAQPPREAAAVSAPSVGLGSHAANSRLDIRI